LRRWFNPNFLEARLLLGTAFIETNDWRKAEVALRRAITISPKTAPPYFAFSEVNHAWRIFLKEGQ
jgi:hypothetical protein